MSATEKVGDHHRPMPTNLEAEQALLGALLVNNEAAHLVSAFLRADHFALPVHGRIYDAVLTLMGRAEIANPVTLNHHFENDEALEEAGGGQYLARLAASAVTVINAEHYGRAIHDMALRRGLIALAEDAAEKAAAAPLDRSATELIEDAEAALRTLLDDGAEARAQRLDMAAAADQALARVERAYKLDGALPGISTGLASVDDAVGGLQAPDLVVVAGSTGMGKTAMGLEWALAAARAGAMTGYVSLEMSAEQLTMRALAGEARLEHHRVRTGRLEQREFDAIYRARHDLADLPLQFSDAGGQTVERIGSDARRWKRKGLALLVVDYLQLIRPSPSMQKALRVYQIAEITGALKSLAKELRIPVVLLSQLNRDPNRRDSKRPTLADLRDSGSIEQDADTVGMIYREEYFLKQSQPDPSREADHAAWQERMDLVRGGAELIVAKNRHGRADTIPLRWDGPTMRFSDPV